jgi:hypothetical protein
MNIHILNMKIHCLHNTFEHYNIINNIRFVYYMICYMILYYILYDVVFSRIGFNTLQSSEQDQLHWSTLRVGSRTIGNFA